jgi:hypothetical protein
MKTLIILAVMVLSGTVFAGSKEYLCSASCSTAGGYFDTRTFELGSGSNLLEAQTKATQKTMQKNKCKFSVKISQCSILKTDRMSYYCTATCQTAGGRYDTKTLTGNYGRNLIESSVLAGQEVVRNHTCRFGVKTNSCTKI